MQEKPVDRYSETESRSDQLNFMRDFRHSFQISQTQFIFFRYVFFTMHTSKKELLTWDVHAW